MKRILCTLLTALLLMGVLAGCQKEASLTLDDSFVIVCSEEKGAVNQAAKSLRIALSQKCGLELELVKEAPAGKKTITVAVDEGLEAGQYRTRIVDGNLTIEAQSAQVMVLAMRDIRQNWLGEACEPKLTSDKLASLCGTVELANAPFLVLTQNIRYADDEGGNMVVQRGPRFQKLVWEYQPDIIALQEDNRIWSLITDKMLGENYGVSGTFSGGPDTTKGNRQSIYYRLDRYELVEEGALWLSDTPDEPYSKLEASKSCRHCTWALLKDNLTGKELLAINTHLDTIGPEVRSAQLQIILDRLGDKMEQYPTIFCGDFNAVPEEAVYATMTGRMSDPHVSATAKLSTIQITCDKYGTWETPMRIDYMFYNDQIVANKYRVMTDLYQDETGCYISDHYGVTTEYSFK